MNTIYVLVPVFLGGLRGWEWVIIALLVLLLFGGKKIPELMRGLGKGIRGFKEGLNDMSDEINKPVGKKDAADSSEKSE
ncbi:MAG: twin-arginine translocase TatA/TatE family subunit [Muribaculaceae bacterium]|nr:twin-arginine translocase TatA/TatE family subunit [Muribaculaceae bacterium]MDE7141781.1 twin-arginine translocase TatA/TatE family subunit [Muribaculaceae bacterium]